MKVLSQFKFLLLVLLLSSCTKEKEVQPVTDVSTLELRIITPVDYTSFNNQIEFKAILSSNWFQEFEIEKDLKAVWESNVDGVLHKETIVDPENIGFVLEDLSPGKHMISLSVNNGNNNVLKDSVRLFNSIRMLEAIPHNNNNIKLKWSQINDPNFESYEVYRGNSEFGTSNLTLLETITDPSVTTFTVFDSELGKKIFYRVKVKFKNETEGYYSNGLEAVLGETLELDYTFSKIVVDPDRPMIYAIVEKSNKPNNTEYGLVFINTETKTVEKHLFKDRRFRDMEITSDGSRLYLNERSHIIYEVNLQTKNLEKTFSVGNIVDNIALGADNKLFYLIHYTNVAGDGIRMYDLNTYSSVNFQTTMTSAQQSFSNGTFVVDEDNVIYYGTSSSSGTIMKISTNMNVFELVDQWNAGYDGPSRMFYSDHVLYWNHYKIDRDFNVLGRYTDHNDSEMRVESISPNGELSTAWRYIIDNSNQEILSRVNVYSDFAVFLNNEDMVFVDNKNPLTNEYYSVLYFYSYQ